LEKSIFRYGLDYLSEKLIQGFSDAEESAVVAYCFIVSTFSGGKVGIIRPILELVF